MSEAEDMQDLLDRYEVVLQEVDQWFGSCVSLYGNEIACCSGCSSCCRGLFDITLMDALFLKRGFERLSIHVQEQIRQKALARLQVIHAAWPSFQSPWLLNNLPESDWDAIMPDDDESPCVMLGENGGCLAYQHRPMTCRLNGIPLIDVGGDRIFDEWCTLNFRRIDPLLLEDLRHPFNEMFAQELLLFRELTRRHLGEAVNEVDTLIPAAIFMDDEMIKTIRDQWQAGKGQ